MGATAHRPPTGARAVADTLMTAAPPATVLGALHRVRNWGATPGERVMPLPGDALVLDLMRSEATDSHGWGWSDEQTWGNLVEQMVEGEVLGESLEPAELFTNDLLPENAGEWQ